MLTLSLLNERPLNAIEDHHVLPLLLGVKLQGKGLHVLSQFQFPHKNNRRTTFLALSILEAQPMSNIIINLAGLQNAVSNLGIIISSSLYVYLFLLNFSLYLAISSSLFLFFPVLPHLSLHVLPSSILLHSHYNSTGPVTTACWRGEQCLEISPGAPPPASELIHSCSFPSTFCGEKIHPC